MEAGTFLSFSVQASDPDPDQIVTLSALGQPFRGGQFPGFLRQPAPREPG